MSTMRLLAAALLAAMVTAVGGPAPASADPVTGVTCSASTFTVRFNPGVTLLTPQTVQVTAEYRFVNCLSLSQPTIFSGTIDDHETLTNYSCLSLLLPLSLGVVTIHWSDGQTSKVDLTMQVVGVAVVASGPVVSGVFANRQFTAVLAGLPITTPVECLTLQGVQQVTGVIEADIT